jgi:hypothetical protein
MQKIPKQAYKQKEKRNNLKKAQATLDLNNVAPKLSIPLILDLFNYSQRIECGLRIESKYITKDVEWKKTKSERLDEYFKAKISSQSVESSELVEELILDDMQLANFHTLMKRMNLSIEQTNFSFTNTKFSGVADIVAHDKSIKSKDVMKKRVLISIKTTSNINDVDGAQGWGDDNIEEKDELLLEAIHLKLLAKNEWGIEDIPFYFMVFSTKNHWEHKIFKVNVSQERLERHYVNLTSALNFLSLRMTDGWNPYPNYSVCRNCPLSIAICSHSIDIPSVKLINL